MISRLITAAAIALFLTPGLPIWAQEHPEHPKKTTEHPKQGAEKQVSPADISAGIKKNIEAKSKKGNDGLRNVYRQVARQGSGMGLRPTKIDSGQKTQTEKGVTRGTDIMPI